MESNTTTATVSDNGATYKVYGTVRDTYQQPMPGITLRAYNNGLTGKQPLGEAVTAADGTYNISYTLNNINTAALSVGAYDAKNGLLKESGVLYQVPAEQQQDFDLSDKPFAGSPQFDNLLNSLAPFTAEMPLANMTETAENPNISFITQKAGLRKEIVERLVMSARFETLSSIPAYVWYGILSQNVTPVTHTLNLVTIGVGDFEARLSNTFEALMHNPQVTLAGALQRSINANIVSLGAGADLKAISGQLSRQQVAFAAKHPVNGTPSALYQHAKLSGLTDGEIGSFINLRSTHTGPEKDLWEKVKQAPELKKGKKADALQAVFQLARLTGNNAAITEKLVKTENITDVAAVKKLAGNDRHDWTAWLNKHKVVLGDAVPGSNHEERVQHYAARMEAGFTREYPTAAFAARLQKDTKSKLPHRDKVHGFLQKHGHFDLLNDHIGTFLKDDPNALPKKDKEAVTHQVRRIQRVFKLTQAYDSTAVLLNDDIHGPPGV